MLRMLLFNWLYFQKPLWDTGVSPPELQGFTADHLPGRALDLGCGTGTNSITLAKAGWQVTGVDFALRAIWKARKKAYRNGVKVDFRLGDVTRLNKISGFFDLILDIGCLHSLPPKSLSWYIKKIDQFLSPNGTYLIYAFFKNASAVVSPGITAEMIPTLTQTLDLVKRIDSTERGMRPSAWFWFQKRKP